MPPCREHELQVTNALDFGIKPPDTSDLLLHVLSLLGSK